MESKGRRHEKAEVKGKEEGLVPISFATIKFPCHAVKRERERELSKYEGKVDKGTSKVGVGKIHKWKHERAVVVVQLVEQLLPTPEVRSSNQVTGKKLYWT